MSGRDRLQAGERLAQLKRGYTDTIYVGRRALRALCKAAQDVVEAETAIALACWGVRGHTKGRRLDALWQRNAPAHHARIRALRQARNRLACALYRSARRRGDA